ncbi:putative N-acetyltransferase YjaB [Clostridiales bacterium]|nr:putative N-acetyltransferase YjaB [Clostridiales bacterium]
MLIRRAENIDIPKINDLLRQVCLVHHNGRPDLFKYGAQKYADEELIQIISDDEKPVFVAVDEDNTVLGYAFCIFERHINDNILTDVKTLYIDDLCVDESLRGKHIGKQLYDYAASFAKESGCYNLTLNVWNCNESAMKFYEKCGLKPQKTHLETILK